MEKKRENSLEDNKKPLFLGLSIIFSISGYIFGPMILFGGIGFWLGKKYDSMVFIVVALIIALLISNTLIFKRSHAIAQRLSSK